MALSCTVLTCVILKSCDMRESKLPWCLVQTAGAHLLKQYTNTSTQYDYKNSQTNEFRFCAYTIACSVAAALAMLRQREYNEELLTCAFLLTINDFLSVFSMQFSDAALIDTIRYDRRLDSKAEYSDLSSTRDKKKNKKEETKTKKRQCPFNSLQVKIPEGSPEEIGLRVTMEERICERDELSLE